MKTLRLFSLLAALACAALPCPADETPAKSPELQALEDLKSKLTLEKDIDGLKRDILAGKFPSSDTKGLKGEAKFDDKGDFVALVAAHRAIEKVAAGIAREVTTLAADKPIYVVDATFSTKRFVEVDLTKKKFEELGSEAKSLHDDWQVIKQAKVAAVQNPQTPQATEPGRMGLAELGIIVSGIKGTLGSVADIASFFKTDTSRFGADAQASDQLLAAAVAKTARLNFPGQRVAETTDLSMKFKSCQDLVALAQKAHDEAEESQAGLAKANKAEIKSTKARIDSLESAPRTEDQATELAGLREKLEKLSSDPAVAKIVKRGAKILAAFDELKKALLEPNEAGAVLFADLAYADFIASNGDVALLQLHVVFAKASTQIKKNLFRNDRVSYVASAVAWHLMTDRTGVRLSAGQSIGTFKGDENAVLNGSEPAAGAGQDTEQKLAKLEMEIVELRKAKN